MVVKNSVRRVLQCFFSHSMAIVLCLFAVNSFVSAQSVSQLNSLYNVTGSTKLSNGTTMMYRLYVPRNYDKTKKYPIVLHMHGIGERGNNNTVQLNYEIGKPWVADSVQKKWAPFALAPQCPANLNWGNMSTGYADLAGEGAIKLLDSLKKVYPLDTTRFYVTGLSWGGIGTMALMHSYPNKFAAALPCAAQNGKNDGPTIAKTPFWCWHGDKDGTVNVAGSQNFCAAVEKTGASVVRFYIDSSYMNKMLQMASYKGISTDSLTKAIRGGSKYLYTEIRNGGHGHGCDMGWKCPLMVGWLFSWSKVNGQSVRWNGETQVTPKVSLVSTVKAASGNAAIYSINGKKIGFASDFSLKGKTDLHSGVYLVANKNDTRPRVFLGR